MTAPPGSRSRCPSCSEPVVWVRTEARGQQMPLDPDPDPTGNVVMVDIPQTKHQVARVVPPADLPAPQPAYHSHFVTCPAPRRKPKGPRQKSRNCQLCPWSVVAKSQAAGEREWARHYAADHAERCQSCNVRLLWVRAERDMEILALDLEPVDVIGQYVLVPSVTQSVAREIAPGSRGLRTHACATEGDRRAPR